jgi:hypothetical protein
MQNAYHFVDPSREYVEADSEPGESDDKISSEITRGPVREEN